MPTSSFYFTACATMDYVSPTTNKQNHAAVGDAQIGGTKVVLYRTLLSFNVTLAPFEGRPLTPADTIVSAELRGYVQGMAGAGGFACHVERNARDDWRDDQATWNEYKTGSAWTAGGGDVDAVPAALAYTSPAALYDYTIAGLAPYVRDALDYHSGIVQLRFKADDENANHEYDLLADPLDSTRPRLVVAYTSAQVEDTPIAAPARAPLRTVTGASPAPASRPARPVRPVRGVKP